MSVPAPQLPSGSPEPENEVKLSFLEHLRDLRVRIVRALLGIVVGMCAVGWFTPTLTELLMKPVRDALPKDAQQIVYTSAIEPMMAYIKVAMYGGVFVAAPWVLYQLWLFIAPGLYKREKKLVVPFVVSGTVLFYSGVAFTYFVVMPYAFPALAAIAGPDMRPLLTMREQLTLVLAMMLGFGVVFEIPVIIAFLAMIGLVTPQFLAKYRRHAIIVNVILAAIITPTGDPFNLAIMAVPMIVFYEVGILVARIVGKKKAPEPATAS